MPRKKTHYPLSIIDGYPDPEDTNLVPALDPEPASELELELELEPEPSRTGRKKNRNAHTKGSRPDSPSPDTPAPEQIAVPGVSLSPPRNPSLLSQITFPSQKSGPVDIREEIIASEKVSDQYTPPSDNGLNDGPYGKSPQSNTVSSAANTPPVEPGFSTRQPFKIRSPPVSPPQRSARPVSFGGSIPPLPGHLRGAASNYGSPPAPHLPQPHFYGASDIDLGIPKQSRSASSEEAVFAKFVKLSSPSLRTGTGIVASYGDRLTVSTFDGNTIEEIGAVTDLPGTAVDAELLQWASSPDPFASVRPLIAITILSYDPAGNGSGQHILSVSIYSLSQQKLVLDLLSLPPETVQQYIHGSVAIPATPTNHLRLATSGNFLTVSSGRSGEVLVFSPCLDESAATFECLAKFWTTIQPKEQRRDSSHHRAGVSDSPLLNAKKFNVDDNVPILTMSGRWIAVCPPPSSPQSVGVILGEYVIVNKQAGFESTSAGSRPSVNCVVDSPDADTLLGKVARGVAQEVMKAGKWLGDQGMQYWQNYWKKDDPMNSSQQTIPHPTLAYNAPPPYAQFPPTHADLAPVAKEPEIVSMFDLKSAFDGSARRTIAATPFATFKAPNGCSFLSFAPSGLMLLTASRSGDYQYIWDLLETKYSRAAAIAPETENHGSAPNVRQLARFDRLSSSVIVDIAWESSSLSRFAILTKNKTVHLFDLPPSAMRWPPPRKAKKARPTSAPPSGVTEVEHDAAPQGGFLASAMSIAGRTQPMLANLRGRAPSTSGGLAGIGQAGFGIATATGARGSRAVAAGLSRSLGAATETVSRIQHAGENRLHIKSDRDMLAGRLLWVRRASKAGICVLNEHSLKYWQVRKSNARDTRQRDATVFDARKAVSFRITNERSRPPHGYWNLHTTSPNELGNLHPLSFAEIDTNAPFQPFHSDRRVTISLYGTDPPEKVTKPKGLSSKANGRDQWAFGEDIPSIRLNLHPLQSHEDEDPGSVIFRETSVTSDRAGEGEQIVSTSRRKKPKRVQTAHLEGVEHKNELQQEGFFEDDCDVLDFASDRV